MLKATLEATVWISSHTDRHTASVYVSFGPDLLLKTLRCNQSVTRGHVRNMCAHTYLLTAHTNTHLHVFILYLFLSVFMSVCLFNCFIISSLSPSVIIAVFVCVCMCCVVLCRQMFECMFFFPLPSAHD